MGKRFMRFIKSFNKPHFRSPGTAKRMFDMWGYYTKALPPSSKQHNCFNGIQPGAGKGQHTIRVHLHHDHRYCLVADPDDPGAGLSLPSLLIGRGSLWGWGLSLTCLLWLAGRLSGRGLSLSAVSRNSHCGTQVHLSLKTKTQSVWLK